MHASPEPESTSIMSKRDVADRLISVAGGFFKRQGRTGRQFLSPVPRKSGDRYVSVMVAPLNNRRRVEVGGVRVIVEVPEHSNLPIRAVFEWTRSSFGFWYRNSYKIENSDDPVSEFVLVLHNAIRPIKITADGTVSVKSMNRTFETVRKSNVRDRAAKSGMVMG